MIKIIKLGDFDIKFNDIPNYKFGEYKLNNGQIKCKWTKETFDLMFRRFLNELDKDEWEDINLISEI